MNRSASMSFASTAWRLSASCDRTPRISIIVAAITLALWGSPRLEAGIVINTPAGLNPGDTFRIAFVTDAATNGLSNNIGNYNSFVNADATAEAGGGSVLYNGNPLSFKAIGSTPAVSAIANIGQSGAPVYLVSGSEVASSDLTTTGGLWSASLLAPIGEDLQGNVFSTEEAIFTGTLTSGASSTSPLGTATPIFGVSGYTNFYWIDNFGSDARVPLQMYAISQPLTVPAPEPSTIVLATLAGFGAIAYYARRRMADRRRS